MELNSVDLPVAPSTPPLPVRLRRGAAAGAAWMSGWAGHALLFALAEHAWRALLGPQALFAALLASVTVVGALTWLAPGLAWWPSAWGPPPPESAGSDVPVGGLRALLRLSCGLAGPSDARTAAAQDTLALHSALAAPVLSVGLPLALGGPWWSLLLPVALLMLSSPWVLRACARRAARRFAQHRATLERVEAHASGRSASVVRAVLSGLVVTGLTLGACAVWCLGRPAPVRAVGACTVPAGATRVTLPGALPGTPLTVRADAQSVTLEAADGGGPGRLALGAGAGWTAWRTGLRERDEDSAPTVAWVETTAEARRVTLCSSASPEASPRAHQLTLAPAGYRLDDGVPQRVLRSPSSAALALALLLLTLVYSRFGWSALLRTHCGEGRAARAAVTWALVLGSAQLAWVLVTALGA
ncbi:MAG: hypothetical protein KC593_25705 [Myxococcales bacterium]|nr:hypothetical protein [Myxococcales bacterium]MCB9628303.1 hypothetical protein [Sandaracinaceae bacterium]